MRQKLAFGIIAFWIAFGLVLDFLMGTKQSSYLADPVRREVWRLAHAHGTLLMLVYAVYSKLHGISVKAHDNLMFFGAILMPAGFLLGGIGATETDPSPAVLLVPVAGFSFVLGLVLSLRRQK